MHAARERRRLQQYQAASESHKLAMAAERETAGQLKRLKQRQEETRASAMAADHADQRGMNAGDAHAALEYADFLAEQARRSHGRLQELRALTAEAAVELAAAQQAYADQVRAHQLLREANNLQSKRLGRHVARLEEQRSEERFLCTWIACLR